MVNYLAQIFPAMWEVSYQYGTSNEPGKNWSGEKHPLFPATLLPTGQSTPLTLQMVAEKDRLQPVLQPVFDIWPKTSDQNRFEAVACKTGNHGSIATDTGPVQLPVFCLLTRL